MHQKRTVYLAGPITGLTYEHARFGWRADLAEMLNEHIEAWSPMRAKEFLQDRGILKSDPATYGDNPFASARGVNARDMNDVKMCDVMVACFIEAEDDAASIGTAIEFGWATAWRKPIVMIAGAANVHRVHVMTGYLANYIVETVEEGAAVVNHLLTPSV